jgi:diguanylate cyclase (GGDEF)-like protein
MPVSEGTVPYPSSSPTGRLRFLLFALAMPFCAVFAQPGPFPRAELALGAQRLAHAVDANLGAATVLATVEAVGGRAALQQWLLFLADVSAALDAPALADGQLDRATGLALQRGDLRIAIDGLSASAQSALALGDYGRALAHAKRLRGLSRQAGDLAGEAQADSVAGVIARRRGQLDAALQLQQRAIAAFREAGDDIGAMRALSDLGTIWRDRGDYARALDAQLEATAARERSGDRLDNVYRNIALLYREIEDHEAARDYFQRALAKADERGVPSAYSSVVGSWASLLNDLGEHAAAHAAAAEALAIDTALGDKPHQGLEQLEIGRALLGQGDVEAATRHLEEALRLGRELGQREIVARALLHLTEGALAVRDTLRARGLIDEAMAGLEAARLRPQLAQAYALREQLARAEHNDAEALRYAHKHATAREELMGIRASRQLAALEARHARAENEQRLVLLAKDNDLQSARLAQQELQRRFGLAAIAGLGLLLVALVWRHLGVRRLNRELALRNAQIEHQRAALGEANLRLQVQATDLRTAAATDSLTGTSNRREVLERLGERFAECLETQRPLALMLLDFDHFKQINDICGHLGGDRALIAGAATLRDCLGADDLLGRFGGEEFIVVVRNREPAIVMALAERMRAQVADELARLMPDLKSIATICIGVAFLSDLGIDARPEQLLEAADQALYEAKNDGRNRVRRRRAA